MKIQYDQSILTTEERIEAQELLFSMGFTWCEGARVQYQSANFIATYDTQLAYCEAKSCMCKLVTLAELRELANPWREVAKVGFPKETDYPVFVWQEGKHVGYAASGYHYPYSCNTGRIESYSFDEDATITHWKRAPRIVAPEPPVVKQSKDVPPNGYRLYAPDEVIQSGEGQFYWFYDEKKWVQLEDREPMSSWMLQRQASDIYACPEHWKPQYRTITIEGKEYLASEVKERLAQLKPIN